MGLQDSGTVKAVHDPKRTQGKYDLLCGRRNEGNETGGRLGNHSRRLHLHRCRIDDR